MKLIYLSVLLSALCSLIPQTESTNIVVGALAAYGGYNLGTKVWKRFRKSGKVPAGHPVDAFGRPIIKRGGPYPNQESVFTQYRAVNTHNNVLLSPGAKRLLTDDTPRKVQVQQADGSTRMMVADDVPLPPLNHVSVVMVDIQGALHHHVLPLTITKSTGGEPIGIPNGTMPKGVLQYWITNVEKVGYKMGRGMSATGPEVYYGEEKDTRTQVKEGIKQVAEFINDPYQRP